MFQDLEFALGEVEFKAGIPDVKFSKVRLSEFLLFLLSNVSEDLDSSIAY